MIRCNSKVRLLNQETAHTDGMGRPVKVGTIGIVKAMRDDPDGRKLLVKFDGHFTLKHTSIENVEELVTDHNDKRRT